MSDKQINLLFTLCVREIASLQPYLTLTTTNVNRLVLFAVIDGHTGSNRLVLS